MNEESLGRERAWAEKSMRTLGDVLVWYNNLDLVPFLEALDKLIRFRRRYGVDRLKETISLPGLAFKFEKSFLKEQGLHLSSFHSEELYQLFKDNLVDGPAIIFHRHAEKYQAKIRQSQYGQEARPVQRVLGYNANALYSWALSQPMPVGLLPPGASVENEKKTGQTRLLRFVPFVHLPFVFRSFDLFVASLFRTVCKYSR